LFSHFLCSWDNNTSHNYDMQLWRDNNNRNNNNSRNDNNGNNNRI